MVRTRCSPDSCKGASTPSYEYKFVICCYIQIFFYGRCVSAPIAIGGDQKLPYFLAFRATMEEENAQEEEQLFDQLPETRILDHRHNNTPGGNQVAWLNADRGRILGPSRSQEVQEGDSIELGVFGIPIHRESIPRRFGSVLRLLHEQDWIRKSSVHWENTVKTSLLPPMNLPWRM
ncbi:hypothetical protein [Algoriphagus marincola]|uniref:hypothetical protein n=1 Tax=Algoriphagus marincola TaxID=264027 RepID=UPI0012DEE8AA|nr:hypothetical protein [Algoriphagus marincola]